MLTFEPAAEAARPVPNRADVAAFIGHVARRPGAPDAATQRALREAGWLGGAWGVSAERIASLWQLPVVVESWDAFQRLFEPQRPLLPPAAGVVGSERCATALGAAVRSFFALGGERAVIVRTGDPWPYLEGSVQAALRLERVRALLPGFDGGIAAQGTEPPSWRGIEHLFGSAEPAMVCLPDLPELFARPPMLPTPLPPSVAVPEGFVECSEGEAPPPTDGVLRRVQAPALDDAGLAAWARAVAWAQGFLARHRRDVLFVGAVPLCHALTPVQAQVARHDPLAWLQQVTAPVLQPMGGTPHGASSAFVQLAWPWLSLRHGSDLPQRLEPPDGALAGVLAANALQRGTFRSAAGRVLKAVAGGSPMPEVTLDPQAPWSRLAGRVCVFAPRGDGWVLQSDVTTSPDRAWQGGNVSRLMAAVLRAARSAGEEQLFEANGPQLWTRLRQAVEAVLDGFWREGGLNGASADEAYDVRCDRSTMSQNDLDHGRLKVEIVVWPVAAVERIRVVLALTADDRTGALVREAA